MNHVENLSSVERAAWSALSCHSTVKELGPHVTADQARILLDASELLREIALARPPIQPAREWRTPTENRLALAANLGAARDAVSQKPKSWFKSRRNGSGPVSLEEQRAHADRMNGR